MSQKKFLFAILLLVVTASIAAAQANQSGRRLQSPSEAVSEALSADRPATVGQAGMPVLLSHIERGNSQFAKADYESALREYRSVPRSDGETYAQALYNIGVCYYELWRTEEAIDFYRQALEVRHGRYPRASYALGVALENQRQLAEAKAAYRQSIDASQGMHALAYYRLGLLISMDGDHEGAAACFRKAIARAGEHVPASHNNLGVMLARQGRLTEAGREFEIALKQTSGVFDDAAHNLKLCRSLLATQTMTQIAELKIADLNATDLRKYTK